MNQVSGSRVRSADLLALAVAIDPGVTARTLELWRNKGLLPHPERTGQDGARPVWTYPAEAATQLSALLELRKSTKELHILSAALWFEGFPVPTSRSRSAILTYLRGMREEIETELAKLGAPEPDACDVSTARWQAIEAVARRLAGKRGKNALRVSRPSLDERTRAYALVIGLGLGEAGVTDRLTSDAPAFERTTGLDRGRRFRPAGTEPWISGPPEEGLARFLEFGSLPRLLSALETATDEALEAARASARMVVDGIALFSQLADAFAGYSNATGMAAVGVLRGDPTIRILSIAFIVSLTQDPVMRSNLGAIDTALATSVLPVAAKLQALAALPSGERATKLPGIDALPWPQRRALERAVESFQPDSGHTAE